MQYDKGILIWKIRGGRPFVHVHFNPITRIDMIAVNSVSFNDIVKPEDIVVVFATTKSIMVAKKGKTELIGSIPATQYIQGLDVSPDGNNIVIITTEFTSAGNKLECGTINFASHSRLFNAEEVKNMTRKTETSEIKN